jgi:hypothetical protein
MLSLANGMAGYVNLHDQSNDLYNTLSSVTWLADRRVWECHCVAFTCLVWSGVELPNGTDGFPCRYDVFLLKSVARSLKNTSLDILYIKMGIILIDCKAVCTVYQLQSSSLMSCFTSSTKFTLQTIICFFIMRVRYCTY